jgi:hypothetical protein
LSKTGRQLEALVEFNLGIANLIGLLIIVGGIALLVGAGRRVTKR